MADRRLLRSDLLLAVLTLPLLVAGVGYLTRGSIILFAAPTDLHIRWTEQQYVFRGKNPLDVTERLRALQRGEPVPETGRDSRPDPDLGWIYGPYPPWSYFTGAALFWPSTRAGARLFFGALNLALLAFLAIWAYRLGRTYGGGWAGMLTAAALLATSSLCTTLQLGQYGLLVLAALAAVHLLESRRHWLLPGCLVGVTLTKVTLAGPFLLPLLVGRRWRILAVASGYVLLGSLVIWHATATDPVEMLGQMSRCGAHFALRGYSLINPLAAAGLSTSTAMRAAALTLAGTALVLLLIWRSAPVLTHFAIAAVAARLGTYHRHYDNLILVFLLLALAIWFLRRRTLFTLAVFLLMGASLWPPARVCDIPVYRTYQIAAWCGCLAVLLYLERPWVRSSSSTSGS